MWWTKFHPHTQQQAYLQVVYVETACFSIAKWDDKRFWAKIFFYYYFLLNLPEMRQSVRGHSAAVWLGIANGMQGIHPVMYHLWVFNQDRSVLSIGSFNVLFLGSSWKICRMVPLEPSCVGRFVAEQNGSSHSMNLNCPYSTKWYMTQNVHHITHRTFLMGTLISLANI